MAVSKDNRSGARRERDDGRTGLNIVFPRDFRERVRAAARYKGCTSTQLVREGLERRVVEIEAEIRDAAEARAVAAAAKKRPQARFRLGQSPLAPQPVTAPSLATPSATATPREARLAKIYNMAAQEALDASGDAPLIQRIVAAAIARIHHELPLRPPPDAVIIAAIEQEMIRLRDDGPSETRSLDSLIE